MGSTTATCVPGYPYTALIFVAACRLVVIDTIYQYPSNTLAGVAILLLGVRYAVWHHLKKKRVPTA